MIGWIRLHRSIKEHWIYNDEKKLKWWIDVVTIDGVKFVYLK